MKGNFESKCSQQRESTSPSTTCCSLAKNLPLSGHPVLTPFLRLMAVLLSRVRHLLFLVYSEFQMISVSLLTYRQSLTFPFYSVNGRMLPLSHTANRLKIHSFKGSIEKIL